MAIVFGGLLVVAGVTLIGLAVHGTFDTAVDVLKAPAAA